jgi:hypothetical protein
MGAAIERAKGKRGYRSQYSTRRRVERLRERLELEQDSKVRATIDAQLRAFDRPPRGCHD